MDSADALASWPMCQVHLALQKDSNTDVTRPLWLRVTLLCILIGSDVLLALALRLPPRPGKDTSGAFQNRMTSWEGALERLLQSLPGSLLFPGVGVSPH